MRVCLFEDRSVLSLEPLTLTRPAYELWCGLSTFADKQFRHFGAGDRGSLVRPYLAEVCRQNDPHVCVNDLAWLRAGLTVLVEM